LVGDIVGALGKILGSNWAGNYITNL